MGIVKPAGTAGHMNLHEADFYRWAMETAAALRRGETEGIDLGTVAEEIEDLGRSEKRELFNRLVQLMLHVAKWVYQPDKRTISWRASVNVQRKAIAKLLNENPSLRAQLDELVREAYSMSVDRAVEETQLPYEAFPRDCPFRPEDLMMKELDSF